jgi:predicted TIM-barrel fold metal-dependent hydrolase
VPERFPTLTIAFLEAGSGWVPYFLERMDEEYDKRGHAEARTLRHPPSEYFRSGRIYVSCEADEVLLPQALAFMGEDQIVYASDFPHWDHSYPRSLKALIDRPDLTEDQKRKVLGANARRLYHLS